MTQQTERQRLLEPIEWPSTYACEYDCAYECCDRQLSTDVATWRFGRVFLSALPAVLAVPNMFALSSCTGPGNYLGSSAMVGITGSVGAALSLLGLCLNAGPRCFGNRNACKLGVPMLCAADIGTALSLTALAANVIFMALPLAMCEEAPSIP